MKDPFSRNGRALRNMIEARRWHCTGSRRLKSAGSLTGKKEVEIYQLDYEKDVPKYF